MSIPGALRSKTSRVTIKNPRPRKYASAAEKQAAFRARFPTICVRVEQKTADTIQKIGDASGRTQQETMLSLVKFALTNRDFVNLGLTEHKQLPRMDETRKANPMKKQPSAAQIAARERFAEMARSGAFTRSKSKRKKNPLTYGLDGVVNITDTYERSVASSRGLAEHYANQLRMRGRDDIVYVVFGITPEAKAQAGRLRNGVTITLNPRDYEIAYAFHPTRGEISRELKAQRDAERRAYTRQGMTLKRNPAKKTVSQKISQLTREGYPQKQAVAIALNEERKGKVKRNPISKKSVDAVIAEQFKKLLAQGMTLEQAWNQIFGKQVSYKDFMSDLYDELRAKGEKRVSNPRASNPAKRSTYQYALVPDDGGLGFGMDSRTPVQFVFSNRDRTRGIYRSFKLPASVTSNPEFQDFASRLPGNSIVASLDGLRGMLKKYA